MRLAVWVLAALFVVSAAWGAGEQLPEMSAPPAADAATLAAGSVQAREIPSTPNATLRAVYCSDTDHAAGTCGEKEESVALLPAWRWRDSTQLASNYGTSDVASGKPIMSVLASFFFAIAQFVWGILLWVVKIALDLNLADVAAGRINSAFASLGGALGGGSGLVILVILVGLAAAARALLRGNMPRAVGIALAVILPIAALQAMTTAAAGGGGAGQGSLSPTGSPGWVAQRGTGMINDVGIGVASSLRNISGQGTQRSPGAEYGTSDLSPNCAQYTAALYDQYGKLSGTLAQSRTPTGSFNGVNATSTVSLSDQVSTVSWLWERAFLSGYIQAQFNSLEHGARTYCHHMEHEAGIQPNIQQTVTQLGTPGLPAQASDAVFRSHGNQKDQEASIFGWAACSTKDGAWSMGAGWTIVSLSNKPAETCDKWWNEGGPGIDAFKWATLSDLTTVGSTTLTPVGDAGADDLLKCQEGIGEVARSRDMTADEKELAYADLFEEGEVCGSDKVTIEATTPAVIDEAMGTVTGFWGHNVGARLFGSILALLTALAYGYALGAVAIGSIIAQFGLVVMLILLPATLLLLAFPGTKSGNPSSMHMAGRRLLRMTGGFFIAQLAFVLVMVLLVQVILLLESLVGGQGGSLWNMLIPLAALFLIRKIIKSMGLGDITKPTGALGLASSAAMGGNVGAKLSASTAGAKGALARKAREGGAKEGDSMSKRAAAALRASKAGSAFAKSNMFGKKLADSRLGQRMALGERWAQKFGDKETGQLGMAQQLRSLAGWAELARGTDPNSLRGKTLRAMGRSELGRRLASVETKPDGSSVYGGFAYRNKDKQSAAVVAANQRAQRRAEIKAISGKNREQRQEARRDLLSERSFTGRERFQVSRDASGEVMRTEDGAAIYGYMDAEGRHFRVRDGQAVNASGAPVDMSGLTAVTAPEEYLSNAAMVEIGRNFMEANGLRGNGDFVVNRFGEAPEIVPRMANASGRGRTPQGKREEFTIDLVRSTGTWALSEHQKARPAGMTDSSWAFMIARMEEEMGARDPETGARVDFAAEHGINLDTEVGRAELRKEQMGQPSAFDNIHYEIPSDRYAAILSAAKDLDRKDGPRKEIVAEARAQRDLEARQLADGAREVAQGIQVRYAAASQARSQVAAAAQKIEVTLPKMEAAVEARAQAQQHYDLVISGMDRPGQASDLIDLVTTFRTPERFVAETGLTAADFAQGAAAAGALEAVMTSSRQEAELAGAIADLQDKLSSAQSSLIEDAEASIADIVNGAAESQKLKYGFELMLADKGKRDTSAIIDAADDFEKYELPDLKNKLTAEVNTAIARLQDAVESGDALRQRDAAKSLEDLIKRESAKVAGDLQSAASKFPSAVQSAAQTELANVRFTDREVPRSRDFAALGSSFPD